MYLFFDTETTGLPKNYKAPITDTNNWPRLVQLGYVFHDSFMNKLYEGDCIIRPDGFIIPVESSKIHGITHEMALEQGLELTQSLMEFNELISKAQYIVGHNISFDIKIIGSEMYRCGIETELLQKKSICTMESSTNHCKITGPYGYKWPKLQELHCKLFGDEFESAHNAVADIGATIKCFYELKRLGIIQ